MGLVPVLDFLHPAYCTVRKPCIGFVGTVITHRTQVLVDCADIVKEERDKEILRIAYRITHTHNRTESNCGFSTHSLEVDYADILVDYADIHVLVDYVDIVVGYADIHVVKEGRWRDSENCLPDMS